MKSIEKISQEVYRIEIPIPIPALRYVNTYVIEDEEKVILIDTGMPVKSSLEILENSLNTIGLDINKISIIIITHLHIDHIGGAYYIKKNSGASIYLSEKERGYIEYIINKLVRARQDVYEEFLLKTGTPINIIKKIVDILRISYIYPDVYSDATRNIGLYDGDKISIKKESYLKIITTPGHSPDHICIYYEDRKLLFTGDHVLPKITPNIRAPLTEEDSLDEYLRSLDKISDIHVEMYLPGHGNPSRTLKNRIEELKRHCIDRLIEVATAISDFPKSIYEIAGKVTWDLNIPWEDFPPIQIFFAVSETMAYVNYLFKRGFAEKIIDENLNKYKLVGGKDIEGIEKILKKKILGL